jgi:hypothetical protein
MYTKICGAEKHIQKLNYSTVVVDFFNMWYEFIDKSIKNETNADHFIENDTNNDELLNNSEGFAQMSQAFKDKLKTIMIQEKTIQDSWLNYIMPCHLKSMLKKKLENEIVKCYTFFNNSIFAENNDMAEILFIMWNIHQIKVNARKILACGTNLLNSHRTSKRYNLQTIKLFVKQQYSRYVLLHTNEDTTLLQQWCDYYKAFFDLQKEDAETNYRTKLIAFAEQYNNQIANKEGSCFINIHSEERSAIQSFLKQQEEKIALCKEKYIKKLSENSNITNIIKNNFIATIQETYKNNKKVIHEKEYKALRSRIFALYDGLICVYHHIAEETLYFLMIYVLIGAGFSFLLYTFKKEILKNKTRLVRRQLAVLCFLLIISLGLLFTYSFMFEPSKSNFKK